MQNLSPFSDHRRRLFLAKMVSKWYWETEVEQIILRNWIVTLFIYDGFTIFFQKFKIFHISVVLLKFIYYFLFLFIKMLRKILFYIFFWILSLTIIMNFLNIGYVQIIQQYCILILFVILFSSLCFHFFFDWPLWQLWKTKEFLSKLEKMPTFFSVELSVHLTN